MPIQAETNQREDTIKTMQQGIANEKTAISRNPCKLCAMRGKRICGCGGGGGAGGSAGGGSQSSETSDSHPLIETEKKDAHDKDATFVFDAALFDEANLDEKILQILQFIASNFDFILSELSKFFKETNHPLLKDVDLSGCKAKFIDNKLIITLSDTMTAEQQTVFMGEFLHYIQHTFGLTPNELGLSKQSVRSPMIVFQREELRLTKEQQQTLQLLQSQFNTCLQDLKLSRYGCKTEIKGNQLFITLQDTIKPERQSAIIDTFKRAVKEELGLKFEDHVRIQYKQTPEHFSTLNDMEVERPKSIFEIKTPQCVPKGAE